MCECCWVDGDLEALIEECPHYDREEYNPVIGDAPVLRCKDCGVILRDI